ncbi:hypothetical protein, partial [Mycobacterium tuberculosis]|uniref:hypothetical protein n=1 Tax=Mycobacterium tuberculosis TaxID=1773 RepID=UPI00254D3257
CGASAVTGGNGGTGGAGGNGADGGLLFGNGGNGGSGATIAVMSLMADTPAAGIRRLHGGRRNGLRHGCDGRNPFLEP